MSIPIFRVCIVEKRPITPDVSRPNDQNTPRTLEDFSYVDSQSTLRDLGDVNTPRNFSEAMPLDEQVTPKASDNSLVPLYEKIIIGFFFYVDRTSHGRHDAIYPVDKDLQFSEKQANHGLYCHVKENYLPGAELENPRPMSMQQGPETTIEYITERIGHIVEFATGMFFSHINDVIKRHKAKGTLINSPENLQNLSNEMLEVDNPRQMFLGKTNQFYLDKSAWTEA
ncbi:unnamed protein product [Clonostachys byssicola]|uniref:Uncharacterized protein n=1 Tax=Clonostachys byssicola TaxID=160290 RepID=A0A9N9UBW9_9HYPO|nr:unnamed protein product [Clonostachys byssicola]